MTIAIIGGGVGGMAAAYDFAKAGQEVTIYEAADHVGGLAAGFTIPRWDWSVEHYYHHWFASDHHILGLIEELGLRERVLFLRPITAVYHQGEFYPLDSPLSVLQFPGLSFVNRLRMGMVVAYLKYVARWEPLEKVTAHRWMRRAVGGRAYEILWEPLLIGKFGPHYQEVNMAWMWARFKARTPRLGTYEGGFQAFNEDLAARLEGMGVRIRLGTPVESIQPDADGGLRLRHAAGEQRVDQCLTTTSPALLARMAPALPAAYLERLLAMKSMGAVVMILALEHQLSESGIYWHNLPKEAGFPFLSLVEHTNFLPPEHFGGDHVVYCGDYLDPDHEYFASDEGDLLERFLAALPRFNAKFSRTWVKDTWLHRTRYAQPVPSVNHSKAIPDLKTPIPGLWLASMSQVYPWDRGTNFAVEVARRAARRMLHEGP